MHHRDEPRAALRAVMATALAGLLVACGAQATSPTQAPTPVASRPSSGASAAPVVGEVQPPPGSDSTVYAPNPGAIVVAIDPGHGGCLDWGVPDPSERGVELAEKTLTLEIGMRLRELLEAEGVTVVMIREGDEALAGDRYAPLGCEGPEWRDVNGDGLAGFGPDLPEATRTRDELQARIDLANLVAADALVSIHINSPSEGGQRIEIAFTETFYTDETPWGAQATARLAELLQDGVVDRLDDVATYERGDRGTTAHNFYLVAPPLTEVTPERDDPRRQPTRGGLMPVVLAEIGSITLRSEHDLLASPEGQDAVAAGLFDGLAAFFSERSTAARIQLADAAPGDRPRELPGEGPPFAAARMPDGPLRLRITNTGDDPLPAGAELLLGWEAGDVPYLASPPPDLRTLDVDLPALDPGASVLVEAERPELPNERGVAWISLRSRTGTLADDGSPALQLITEAH